MFKAGSLGRVALHLSLVPGFTGSCSPEKTSRGEPLPVVVSTAGIAAGYCWMPWMPQVSYPLAMLEICLQSVLGRVSRVVFL